MGDGRLSLLFSAAVGIFPHNSRKSKMRPILFTHDTHHRGWWRPSRPVRLLCSTAVRWASRRMAGWTRCRICSPPSARWPAARCVSCGICSTFSTVLCRAAGIHSGSGPDCCGWASQNSSQQWLSCTSGDARPNKEESRGLQTWQTEHLPPVLLIVIILCNN